jgi:class 3 adenylate cyclase
MFPQFEVRPSLKKRVLSQLKRFKRERHCKPGAAPPHFKATIRALPENMGIGKRREDPFSNATVMFADLAGLAAWSANKAPEEKDSLLESVHRSLNAIAKRYGIYQVEMAGDCFVAVTGVQDLEDDHAAMMAHFACDCRKRLIESFKTMQARGLSVRFGIHSGHVQAGLYGDENSRFELFGDTVDTTYQMLTNGKPNKIHVSVETAELLNLAGKSHWISPRKDLVLVKGKGEMSTFWIKTKACLSTEESKGMFARLDVSTHSDSTFEDSDLWIESSSTHSGSQQTEVSQFQSVVDRNVEVLLSYLKKIHSRRISLRNSGHRKPREEEQEIGMGDPIIEEAREVVMMPPFDSVVAMNMAQSESVELSFEVESQLRLYVSSIASTYRSVEFHNFEHATHAATAMDKMIKRITKPDEPEIYMDFGGKPREAEAVASDLDSRTFGIASDPLTQFALVFGTVVHDVDHVGVSNHQLVKEKSPTAALYKNKSVAEQNSVDIAWWLLMTPTFADLRAAVYSDAMELRRFRQLLVNSVIATDILDRDLISYRDKRWKKAFKKGSSDYDHDTIRDLQATVVIEHAMQAADAAHTMQSFRTYLKWSEKLFEEMYQAHHAGRADKDPAASWYMGELAFFDKFVIPLATRLRDCGIYGASGDEYLKNALENRRLWVDKGKTIARDMKETFSRKVVGAQEDTIVFT